MSGDEMTHSDELRGSAPMLSAKDVLLEVRADVKLIGRNVDILVSQNLDKRLSTVEAWQAQVTGRIIGISAAVSFAVAAVGIIIGLIALT